MPKHRIANEFATLREIGVHEFYAAKFPAVGAAGKLVQKTFWAHRLTMDASFAHKSFEFRQKQAEGICRSMSKDAHDVNENNENLRGNEIQLELDFRYVDGQGAPKQIQVIPMVETTYTKAVAKKKPR